MTDLEMHALAQGGAERSGPEAHWLRRERPRLKPRAVDPVMPGLCDHGGGPDREGADAALSADRDRRSFPAGSA